MIITEYYRNTNDGKTLVKTYSNENYFIKNVDTDKVYESAIDIGYYDINTKCYKPMYYSYKETQELIPTEEDLNMKGAKSNE